MILPAPTGYAAQGWPIFPCKPGQKRPATEHGFRDATTDPAHARRMFANVPGANVGMATGRLFDVLDLDRKPGGPDATALWAWLDREGWLAGAVGIARTRNGGAHVYYPAGGQPSGSLPRLGVDFKSGGGYVLLPPSRVPADMPDASGRYEWVRFPTGSGHPLDWAALRERLAPAPRPAAQPPTHADRGRRIGGILRTVATAQPGTRNRALFWAACRMHELDALTAGRADLITAALAAGLDEREAQRTITSAARTAGGAP